MVRIYDVAPLQVWRDDEAASLQFEWFGIAPSGADFRLLFEQTLDVWRAEQLTFGARRPLGCLMDLRHLLIPQPTDVQWLIESWGPMLLRAGAGQPLVVLSEDQLAVSAPLMPCAQVLPADDDPITAPALFADPARARLQLRRRADHPVAAG